MHFTGNISVTLQYVITAIAQQKCGKACGPDGIQMEAYIFASHRLYVYISLLFNLCMMSGYLPDGFMSTDISPMVKCSSGDLTDVNNYRAISLSNSISKILEHV